MVPDATEPFAAYLNHNLEKMEILDLSLVASMVNSGMHEFHFMVY